MLFLFPLSIPELYSHFLSLPFQLFLFPLSILSFPVVSIPTFYPFPSSCFYSHFLSFPLQLFLLPLSIPPFPVVSIPTGYPFLSSCFYSHFLSHLVSLCIATFTNTADFTSVHLYHPIASCNLKNKIYPHYVYIHNHSFVLYMYYNITFTI